MHSFHIIEANPEDVIELVLLSRKIFYDSFRAQNTETNIKEYMDRAYNHEALLKELNDPASEFYFICDHQKKVGFLKLNHPGAQTDLNDPDSLEIERIYIDIAYQGNGLGAILLEKAKLRARETHRDYIWLGVWEKNTSAIRFYEQHGFVLFGSHPFVMGDEEQTDLLMKYQIREELVNYE